jgi:periplasmic divalent cation tolerance protein
MESFVQVFTTTDSKENAQDIARILVERRLAGCVQIIGPISSVYQWKGKVENDEEWLCIIKSEQRCFEEIREAIKANHPYETPEIIATAVVAGSNGYLRWLANELKPVPSQP